MKVTRVSFDRFITSVKANFAYLTVWSIAVLTVLIINFFAAKSYTFIGVTESKTLNVNLKYAVFVKKVNVVNGEQVKTGQLLLELSRPDLTLKINEVSHKLEVLVSEYKLNDRLNGQLKSINANQNSNEENLLGIQIRSLEKELKLLFIEKEELYIFATFDGFVGSVNFKRGESVSPFENVMTVHDTTPTTIKAYIHENNADKVSNNLKVKVTSINGDKKVVGKILNVGTQIVEFPARFLRSTDQKLWGREVTVEIPTGTDLLLAEKVFIELTDEKLVNLNQGKMIDNSSKYKKIIIPDSLKNEHIFEPSGITYIADLDKYLFVSDDTKEDKGLINILNQDGSIDNHIIEIEGISKIKDMEAIVESDDGALYISSSLSLSKKKKISNARKQFIRLKRDGLKFKVDGQINLYDELNSIAKNNKKLDWVKLLLNRKLNTLKKYSILLDVEGIFVQDNILYLGLRSPLGINKEVIILMVKDINLSLENNKIAKEQVNIARIVTLPIKISSDRNEGISDLLMIKDDLYIVTASNSKLNRGRVLKTKVLKGFPVEEVIRFYEYRPEAISFNSKDKAFRVLFDNNKGKDLFFSEFRI
jgi:hypothetical protein